MATQRQSPEHNILRCDDAYKFAQIFFTKQDSAKEGLVELYHNNATLIWNGQVSKNKTNIAKFYQSLKPTETTLQSLDTQILPPMGELVDLTTIIAGGKMKQNDNSYNFSRVIVLGVQDNACLIVSDTLRLSSI